MAFYACELCVFLCDDTYLLRARALETISGPTRLGEHRCANINTDFVEIKVPMRATSPRCRLHANTVRRCEIVFAQQLCCFNMLLECLCCSGAKSSGTARSLKESLADCEASHDIWCLHMSLFVARKEGLVGCYKRQLDLHPATS